ncbi:MAG TPA: vitamin K epoxide reductase family protein [Candidatus Paceibacterota bacterium]
MQSILYLIIILSAFSGFVLAFYIRHKKRSHEKMICLVGSNCDNVIYSPYSRFFEIPVELLGMFYYGVIAVLYTIFIVFPSFVSPFLIFGVLAMSMAAFLFSLYLTFIQAFALKQWCTWCLTSAGLCTIIFFSALFLSKFGFIDLLAQHRDVVTIFHVLGVALGLGAATITDIFFFKFLKDYKISEFEAEIMHTLSQIIWFALGVIVLSGIGLYLPESERLLASSKFLTKLVVVSIIIINGALLNLIVAPQLIKITFGGKHAHKSGELHRERKIAFALGAVSVASWYSAFILGSLKSIPISFPYLVGLYILLLFGAIIGSQFVERVFVKRED